MTPSPHRPAASRRRRAFGGGLTATAIVALALCATAPGLGIAQGQTGSTGPPGSDAATANAFDDQGMWIWYVSRSHGGSVAKIVSQAKRAGVGTVYVKSGDGGTYWRQFSRSLVSALHARGLQVCAWQFVYGDAPYKEANVGAAAKEKGADCLIIDAEGQYSGKYASADRYIRKLRAQVGADFPLSLASFPYVDYHPGFPYSVFLGPEGAQSNQPQMYWKTIGTSIGRVYAHTYSYNRVYERPIHPIGQTYDEPGPGSIKRFRRYALTYGSGGVSWWSWQETSEREWGVLAGKVRKVPGVRTASVLPTLRRGSRGDLVVWAQQHLISAGQPQLPVTGLYKGQTRNAVIGFQQQKGLNPDGVIGTETWHRLLEVDPVRVAWGSSVYGRSRSLAARPGAAEAPPSASLPAHRNEIDPGRRP